MLGTQASAQVELKNEKEGKYKLAAENGFDSKKLTAIGRFMDRQIDAGKVVGCSGLIFKDNKLVFQEKYFGNKFYIHQPDLVPGQYWLKIEGSESYRVWPIIKQ